MSRPTRVLLVDDHAMVRRGLRDFLRLFEDIEVVGEAGDGLEALDAAAATTPDVIVMDLNLPRLDGIGAIRELRRLHPGMEVVALTGFVEDERVIAAIEAGAAGFLVKDAEADDIASAIRAARAGELYLDPSVAGIVARHLRGHGGAPETGLDEHNLTPRERDVLALVAQGLPNRAIGESLGITERTARTHVSNILAKLGLASRTQAALFAVDRGLEPEPERGGRRRT